MRNQQSIEQLKLAEQQYTDDCCQYSGGQVYQDLDIIVHSSTLGNGLSHSLRDTSALGWHKRD